MRCHRRTAFVLAIHELSLLESGSAMVYVLLG
jgi:hypothetical protein